MCWGRIFAAATLLIVLIGCGSGVSNQSAPPPQPQPEGTPAPLTGNWHIMTASEKVPGNVMAVMGGLIEKDGNVTGTVQIWISACFFPDNAIRATGRIEDGTLTLAGSSFGQTFALTATLRSDLQTMEGKYSVTGGCADGDFGTLIGLRIPDLSGAWTGNLTSYYDAEERQKEIVSMTLAQSASERGDGWFDITGTATLNMSCFTQADVRGTVMGRVLVLELFDIGNSERYLRILAHANDLGTQAGEGARPLTGWIGGGDNHYNLFGCGDDEGSPFLSKSGSR